MTEAATAEETEHKPKIEYITKYKKVYEMTKEEKEDLMLAMLYSYRYAIDHNELVFGEVVNLFEKHGQHIFKDVLHSIQEECLKNGGRWIEMVKVCSKHLSS